MPHQASEGRQPAADVASAYTATDQDLQTHLDAQQHVDAMRPGLPDFDITRDRNRYVFVAAFDGTGNDAAVKSIPESTNVHALYDDFDRFIHGDGADRPGFSRMHARYIEGPGTQDGTTSSTLDNADGRSVRDRVFEMYKDLGEKSLQWKQENPDAQISVITFGFSRGAVEAAEFASVVGKYGIQANVVYAAQEDDDSRNNTKSWGDTFKGRAPSVPAQTEFANLSGEIVAPGKVPIVAGLFDPVATGIAAERHDRELPKEIRGALQLTALDEHRSLFPVNDIVNADVVARDPDRFANLGLAGCHSDVGGGYSDGQGLAGSARNVMGSYLNNVLGQPIHRTVDVDPDACVVHDSNSSFFQYLGKQQAGYYYADRTQGDDTRTPDGKYAVMSGIDPDLHGNKRVEMPSVNLRLDGTADDALRAQTDNVPARLFPRRDDGHTPEPSEYMQALESTQRGVDPAKLLLESSERVSTLMDIDANPTAARHLRGLAADPDVAQSLQLIGDSARGRLSAAVALAASEEGMDRLAEVAFSRDGTQLIITDRRDTHDGLVNRTSVDIETALRTPMIDSMRALDPNMNRPETLYEQAHRQLLVSGFAEGGSQALVDGSARIASQARNDGLTRIDGLQVLDDQGRNVVVAHQNAGAMTSQPVDGAQFTARQDNTPPLHPQQAQPQAQQNDPQQDAQAQADRHNPQLH